MTETNRRGGRSREPGGGEGAGRASGKSASERVERQAKALRENLRRRKQQQRLRRGAADEDKA